MGRRGEKTDEAGVYRRDDGRYLVVATAKDPDKGKVVSRQRTLKKDKTLEDAVETRDRLKTEIRTPKAPPRAVTTLGDYCNRWIERKAKRVKPRTAKTYAKALGDRVLPVTVVVEGDQMEIGQIPLRRFRRDHVLQWIEWAESRTHDDGTPYSSSTVRKWWRVFRSVIKDLHAAGKIERDHSLRVDAPETGRNGVRQEPALTLDEMHALASAAEEVAEPRHAEICTLVHTGMRTGELWALHWSDLDYDEQVIHIHRSVSSGRITGTTKSNRDRKVPLFEPVADAIQAHRERMIRDQHPGLSTDLVFPSDAGSPRTPGSLRKALRTTADEADIDRRVSPQLIRKSVVTVLRDKGVPAMAAKALVGHSDDAIQEHYYSATGETRALAEVLVGGERESA